MIAEIGGFTIHSWGALQINEMQSDHRQLTQRRAQGISIKCIRCQSLLLIAIHAVILASAESLQSLDVVLRRATRNQRTYKIRVDGAQGSIGGYSLQCLEVCLFLYAAGSDYGLVSCTLQAVEQ